jgi:hypothetical protein
MSVASAEQATGEGSVERLAVKRDQESRFTARLASSSRATV